MSFGGKKSEATLCFRLRAAERSRSLNPASWKKGLGSVYFIFIDALHVC